MSAHSLICSSMEIMFMCLFILYDSIICIFHNDFCFCLLGTHTHIICNWRTIHKAHLETHLMVDLQQCMTITHTQRKTYLRTVPLFLVEAGYCYGFMDIIWKLGKYPRRFFCCSSLAIRHTHWAPHKRAISDIDIWYCDGLTTVCIWLELVVHIFVIRQCKNDRCERLSKRTFSSVFYLN